MDRHGSVDELTQAEIENREHSTEACMDFPPTEKNTIILGKKIVNIF